MKVVFFQPYLAQWRIDFLKRFIKSTKKEIIIYDGGSSNKKSYKSNLRYNAEMDIKKLKSFSPVFTLKKQSYPIYFSPFLFFALCRDKPDVIVTEGEINFINNISIYLYCFLFNKGFVWWSLGKVRARKMNIVNFLFDPIVNFLLRKAHVIMTRTSWAKSYYIAEKKIPEEKIILAPNSMDENKARNEISQDIIDKLKKDYCGDVILYVGALLENKKPKQLIESFYHLYKNNLLRKKTYLWIVGDGPQKRELIAYVNSVNLEGQVIFFGEIFDGVGNYFKAADLVVVPGLGGLVINHAMIFGKPVISGLADGTELDLIDDGETGYLLHNNDVENMASTINKALDPEKLILMSRLARLKIEQFWNMGIMIDRVERSIELASRRIVV